MQINKIYCDRCKKEIKEHKTALIIDLLKGNWYKPIYAEFITHIELCKDCLKDFNSFMDIYKFRYEGDVLQSSATFQTSKREEKKWKKKKLNT